MTTERPQPADAVVQRLRSICERLPEATEVEAWTGTSWRIRNKTFAHLVEVADGWPPAYVRAAGTAGPATVLTFQSSGAELDALSAGGPPFFRPPWRPGTVGLVLDDRPDWDEIAELVTDSYCLLAPRRLAGGVERPGAERPDP